MDGMPELETFGFCGMDATVTFGKGVNLQIPQWRVPTTTLATPKRHGDTMSNRNAGRHAHGQRGWRRRYRVGGEHLIKQKEDIYLLKKHCPPPALQRGLCSFHPKRVIQRKCMCDPQKSLHIAAAALLQQLSDIRPVLGRPALLQKTLQAMITDWTVLNQPFFLCKQNFLKLVVCTGKVQNADVLIHQKILAGMRVLCHLRLPSSTILSPKRYTKSRPRLYNETDLVRMKGLEPT